MLSRTSSINSAPAQHAARQNVLRFGHAMPTDGPEGLPIEDASAYLASVKADEKPSQSFLLGRSHLFRHYEQLRPLGRWFRRKLKQLETGARKQPIDLMFIGPGQGLEEPIGVLSYLQRIVQKTGQNIGKKLTDVATIRFIDIQPQQAFTPKYHFGRSTITYPSDPAVATHLKRLSRSRSLEQLEKHLTPNDDAVLRDFRENLPLETRDLPKAYKRVLKRDPRLAPLIEQLQDWRKDPFEALQQPQFEAVANGLFLDHIRRHWRARPIRPQRHKLFVPPKASRIKGEYEVHPDVQAAIQSGLSNPKSRFATPIENAAQEILTPQSRLGRADAVFCNNVLVHLGVHDPQAGCIGYASPFKPFVIGRDVTPQEFPEVRQTVDNITRIVRPGGLLMMNLDDKGVDLDAIRLARRKGLGPGPKTGRELAEQLIRQTPKFKKRYRPKRDSDPRGVYRRRTKRPKASQP